MKINNKKELFITLIIVFLSFLIRVIRLDIPHDWSFDEVYHALSAEAYALNDPRGYEYWNASPKDLAWEWLHPPIGKLLMAASIKIFAKPYIPVAKSDPVDGVTSFAWRFPGTIFAALTVYLLIIFGKKMFSSFWVGAAAGALYALDGLSFVQSRTGMNDIFVTFFVVWAFYRLYILIADYAGPAARQPQNQPTRGTPLLGHPASHHPLMNLLLLGIASGLAASTKWTGFYMVAIAFIWGEVFLLKQRDFKKFFFGLFYLGLLPFIVYLLSYGQWWLQGHTIKQFYELHQQIWWYQTGLKATHGYQSAALTWPILYRPVWFYVKYQDVVKNGMKQLYIGNIYTMGNPLIWWAGLAGILYLVHQLADWFLHWWKDIKLKTSLLPLGIVLIGYFGMFLPWTLSPRIMFLYHYLPSIPFLCLGLAYTLSQIRKTGPIGRKGVTIYLILVVLAFIYFYPQWSALPLPQKWVDQYYWLPSWK